MRRSLRKGNPLSSRWVVEAPPMPALQPAEPSTALGAAWRRVRGPPEMRVRLPRSLEEARALTDAAGADLMRKLSRNIGFCCIFFAVWTTTDVLKTFLALQSAAGVAAEHHHTVLGLILSLDPMQKLALLWEHSAFLSPLAMLGFLVQARRGLRTTENYLGHIITNAAGFIFFEEVQEAHAKEQGAGREPSANSAAADAGRRAASKYAEELATADGAAALRLLAHRWATQARSGPGSEDDSAAAERLYTLTLSEVQADIFPFLYPLSEFFVRIAQVGLGLQLPVLYSTLKALVLG